MTDEFRGGLPLNFTYSEKYSRNRAVVPRDLRNKIHFYDAYLRNLSV